MRSSAAYITAAKPVVIVNGAGAIVARIECSECRTHDEWRISSRLPPADVLHSHFIRRGWSVKRRPLCELCQAQKRKPPMSINAANSRPILQANGTAAAGHQPSDAAREAKRLVLTALEDHYDECRKCYKPGHSDATVAKETGASEATVSKIREEFFGPLVEPDEVRALREELARVSAALADLQGSFDKLAKRNGWAV